MIGRVWTFESVDAYLREGAVLAAVFHTETALEVERLGQVGGVDGLEELVVHHIDHYGGQLAADLVAVGGYHDFIYLNGFFLHREMNHGGIVTADSYFLFLGGIAQQLHTEGVGSFGDFIEGEMAAFIRHGTLTGLQDQDGCIRQMFFTIFFDDVTAYHVSVLHRIGLDRHSFGSTYDACCTHKHERKQQDMFVHCLFLKMID